MRKRRGAVTVEAILVIPILFIATLAIGQFFIASLVHQSALSAATDGAKVAAAGGDADAVRDKVNEVLSSVNLSVGTQVAMLRETSVLTETRGTFACTAPASPTLAADEVRVTVCVDMTASPMLNALSAFGVSVSGKRMTVSSQLYSE